MSAFREKQALASSGKKREESHWGKAIRRNQMSYEATTAKEKKRRKKIYRRTRRQPPTSPPDIRLTGEPQGGKVHGGRPKIAVALLLLSHHKSLH
jgi:hypothetical protein